MLALRRQVAGEIVRLRAMRALDGAAPPAASYGDIAQSRGWRSAARELRDIELEFADPERYRAVKTELGRTHAARERAVRLVRAHVHASMETRSTVRHKSVASVVDKMERMGVTRVNDLHDLTGVRFVLPAPNECYAALGVVHGQWPHVPQQLRDYIGLPKANGYQSLHTVLRVDEVRVEVQLRCVRMHAAATSGFAAHWRYKTKAPWRLRLLVVARDVEGLLVVSRTLTARCERVDGYERVDASTALFCVSTADGRALTLAINALPEVYRVWAL